jgi:uncharacterized protein (DUF58 family)
VTRTGWATLAGGVVLIIVAIVLQWAPAGVLGVGAVALVALSLAFLLRPQGLSLERHVVPNRVPKFEESLATYRMTNTGPLPVAAQRGEQRLGQQVMRVILPRLSRGATVVRSYPLPTNRRGVFAMPPFETTRQDPFGLMRRTRRFGGEDELWVYPRILPFRSLPTGFSRPAEGPSSETAPQGSITFHRLREYVMGDDIRMVHWKSTARTGKLMVRHNIDTSLPYTVVVVDVRPGMYTEDTFELALDAAASAVVAGINGGGPVQVRLTDGRHSGGDTTLDAQPLLDLLTAAEPSSTGDLVQEMQLLRRERGGTALTVITGPIETMDLAAVSRLRRAYHRVMVVSVVEPDQADDNPVGGSGVRIVTATNDDDLVAAWNLETIR